MDWGDRPPIFSLRRIQSCIPSPSSKSIASRERRLTGDVFRLANFWFWPVADRRQPFSTAVACVPRSAQHGLFCLVQALKISKTTVVAAVPLKNRRGPSSEGVGEKIKFFAVFP